MVNLAVAAEKLVELLGLSDIKGVIFNKNKSLR